MNIICKIAITIFCLHSGLSMALDKVYLDLLSSIPTEDRARLEFLFYRIFNNDHGAYTLFCDKPVSLSGHFKISPWENIIELGLRGSDDEVFGKEWKTWEKYRNLFKIKGYILVKENSKLTGITNIIFINKNEFIKYVKNNSSLFERILGHPFNPEEVLKNIEDGKITFVDSIENNEVLWGVLLGYGKHNSILYSRWHGPFREKPLEYEGIGDYFYTPLIMSSTHFVGNSRHPESIELQNKYRRQRGFISSIYAQGNLFEITLSKLVSSPE